MSFHRSHRAAAIFVACLLWYLGLTRGVTAAPEPPLHEDFMVCNVYDPEIFDNIIAYQEAINTENPEASNGHLMIRRLKGQPMPPFTPNRVFAWLPAQVDPSGVLPPLGETSNGPEVGFDGTEGYEVVYTKLGTPPSNPWLHARAAANLCPFPIGPQCFQVQNFPNDDASHRWGAFVTQNDVQPPEAAKVVYNVGDPDFPLQKRKAFRQLEGTDVSDEITIDGGDDSATIGHWVRIDDKDYIISTLGSADDPVVDVVLYDPDDSTLTPIVLTENNPGRYSLGWMDFDPAAGIDGEHTLVTVRTDTSGHTFLAVFQQNGSAWEFRYEFDAHTADPALPTTYYVSSPEPFHYNERMYIAFIVSSAPGFAGPSVGNVMITRIEDAGDNNPSDNHYRILNVLDDVVPPLTTVPTRKRIEPEIHYLGNGRPVVFYTLVASAGDGDCAAAQFIE